MAGKTKNQEEVLERQEVKTPRRFKVIFFNDNFTSFEFVILVLIKFFNKSEMEAVFLTKKVHEEGKAIAGLYPKQIAETKIKQVTKEAEINGFPLKVIMEAE